MRWRAGIWGKQENERGEVLFQGRLENIVNCDYSGQFCPQGVQRKLSEGPCSCAMKRTRYDRRMKHVVGWRGRTRRKRIEGPVEFSSYPALWNIGTAMLSIHYRHPTKPALGSPSITQGGTDDGMTSVVCLRAEKLSDGEAR